MEERFGLMPNEVNHLFKITELRILCKQLSIEKFDLGKKGLTIKFRNNKFEYFATHNITTSKFKGMNAVLD